MSKPEKKLVIHPYRDLQPSKWNNNNCINKNNILWQASTNPHYITLAWYYYKINIQETGSGNIINLANGIRFLLTDYIRWQIMI